MKKAILLLLICCSIIVAGPVEDAGSAYKKAEAALNELDTDTATSEIQKSIKLIEVNQLKEKQFAKAYVLGAILDMMIGDGNVAEGYLVKALLIDPKTVIAPEFDTPEIATVLKKAQVKAAAEAKKIESFTIDSTKYALNYIPRAKFVVASDFNLRAEIKPILAKTHRAVVYYRSGRQKFSVTPLKNGNGFFEGIIPQKKLRGPSLELYFEILDQNGKVLFAKESAQKPIAIPLEKPVVQKTVKQPVKKMPEGFKPYFGVLEIGTGVGLPQGETEFLHQDTSSGFASSPLFVGGEFGMKLNDDMGGSIGFRIQTVEADWMVSANFKYFLIKNQPLRVTINAGLIVGFIRYQIDVNQGNQSTDVVQNGMVGLNPGVSAVYMFTPMLGVIGGMRALSLIHI